MKQSLSDNPIAALTNGSLWKIKDPSIALELLEVKTCLFFQLLSICHTLNGFHSQQRELAASERDQDGGRNKLVMLLDSEIREQKKQNDFKRSVLHSIATQKHQLLRRDVPNCGIGAQILNPNTGQRPSSSTSSQQEESSSLFSLGSLKICLDKAKKASHFKGPGEREGGHFRNFVFLGGQIYK